MEHKKNNMTREQLIHYIKTNDIYYLSFSFEDHSLYDLQCIKQKVEERIIERKEGKTPEKPIRTLPPKTN